LGRSTVTDLAARLCGEAAPGQILISRRLLGLAEDLVDAEPVGDLTLKRFARPVATFSGRALRESSHPKGDALCVIMWCGSVSLSLA
jgi:class 3 adenylate cyclase